MININKFTLNREAFERWLKNLVTFLAPVAIVYIVAVIGVIQIHNGQFNLNDFIPTSFTMGAVVLYVLNSALDYFRKLKV